MHTITWVDLAGGDRRNQENLVSRRDLPSLIQQRVELFDTLKPRRRTAPGLF